MNHLARQRTCELLLGILLIWAGGCAKSVQGPQVPVAIPQAFSTSGTTALPDAWWQVFQDDDLNALIQQALTNNFTLLAAWDRLAQAHAVAWQTGAALWPQADLRGAASATRRDTGTATTTSNLYSVGVAASYEVDLWSRLRSSRKAAWLDAQASRDAVDTAGITLAATIANTWYQLAEAQTQVRIARNQIETNRKVVEIVTVQFRKGRASAADVLRQRQLVASTEATLIVAQEKVDLLQYGLAVLIGVPPTLAWRDTSVDLPALPDLPDLGVPAEVLQRRPDVRQTFRQVQAADQRLAGAIADQYPRLSLSANIETSAVSASDLFDNWLASIAANAVQPLIDGTRRKAEVQRRRAVVAERLHTWGQTVLYALQDVEVALTQQRQQRELLDNLKRQLQLARETYNRNRERYIKGQADYIRVLESLQSLQTLERNVATAQRLLIERRIDLYRAIAGPCELPESTLARADDPTQTIPNAANPIQDR